MYKILPEEERVIMTSTEVREKYTYWNIVCALCVGNSVNNRIPLAISDDTENSFSDAWDKVKELFPEYEHLTTVVGNIRDASYSRPGQLLR